MYKEQTETRIGRGDGKHDREMTSIPRQECSLDLMDIWNYMLISANGRFPASLSGTHGEFERDYYNFKDFLFRMSLLRQINRLCNTGSTKIIIIQY